MVKAVVVVGPVVREEQIKKVHDALTGAGFTITLRLGDASTKLPDPDIASLLADVSVVVPLLSKEFDASKSCKQILGAVLKQPKITAIPVIVDAKYKASAKEAKTLVANGDFLVTRIDEELNEAEMAHAHQQLLSKLKFAGAETSEGASAAALDQSGKPLATLYTEVCVCCCCLLLLFVVGCV